VEVEELLKKHTGAKRILIFDHTGELEELMHHYLDGAGRVWNWALVYYLGILSGRQGWVY
jgi:hypothetical protein